MSGFILTFFVNNIFRMQQGIDQIFRFIQTDISLYLKVIRAHRNFTCNTIFINQHEFHNMCASEHFKRFKFFFRFTIYFFILCLICNI